MQPLQGTAETGGRVSFVPQNPWCQNLSLRDSILFGMPFEEERYARVTTYKLSRLYTAELPSVPFLLNNPSLNHHHFYAVDLEFLLDSDCSRMKRM